ncbi:MAG TPA: fructose-6-phosphate aldolase [Pelotomaculum sp.]|nr:fructose-6-phosphate aldolase [Pelotomaculum sp.]
MKIFIDTANIDEIREVASWGVLSGVTTNPSLVAESGRDFKELLAEIAGIVDGPISAEVMADDWEGMVEEARDLKKIHKNITIKVPMTEEGLKALGPLAKENIATNMTLIFSVNQALLAARAGATYVSPFLGRTDDIGGSGTQLVKDIADIFKAHDIKTQIIAASPRYPKYTVECALAGAHIATIPYAVLKKMVKHPLTDIGLQMFKDDWNSMNK